MKKLNPLTICALALFAISITVLDFDNLAFKNNIKSYVGLMGFAILISFELFIRYKKEVRRQ